MRILVAGGAGFVGSNLVDQLLEQGHSVVIADNFVTGKYHNLKHVDNHPHVRITHTDLSKTIDPEILGGPFDRVYNLASPASPVGYSRYPIETLMVNALGTYQLLSVARRDGARFLQTSTSEVYGDPQVHPQPEAYWGNVNPIGPRACYDEGKRFAESLVMEFVWQFGLDARISRIFNTYGPRCDPRDGRLVPNFCVQAIRGEDLTVYGDGSQTRSLCYIDDLVRGLQALMETDGLAGEVVNLGNPEEHTILEFAQIILELTRSRSRIVHKPLPVDDPTRRQPVITKAKQLLGWQPTVDLRTGIRHTVRYLEQALTVPA